jgi:hypothetical protein
MPLKHKPQQRNSLSFLDRPLSRGSDRSFPSASVIFFLLKEALPVEKPTRANYGLFSF